MSGLLGVGEGGGGKGHVGPLPKLLGDLAPSPPPPLSFKEESDISSLNGHAEMTTNTVIRLWMDGWMFELFIGAQPQKGI